MKKMLSLFLILVLVLTLCACEGVLSGAFTPPITFSKPPEGLYAVSSVGRDGDVSFYGTVDPDNGYLQIEADGTGVLNFDGQTWVFTMDGTYLRTEDGNIPYSYTVLDTTPDGEAMLTIYFVGETVVSVVFRPTEAPAQSS